MCDGRRVGNQHLGAAQGPHQKQIYEKLFFGVNPFLYCGNVLL